jgi:hypothetical protein
VQRLQSTRPPSAAVAASRSGAEGALQTLYHELTGSGDDSLKAAIEAGVKIEELDIADLEAAIAATAKRDLKRVYVNLLEGSLNHLDAFESNLELVVRWAAPKRPAADFWA